jgi:Flp pilus assembly pilin Flp
VNVEGICWQRHCRAMASAVDSPQENGRVLWGCPMLQVLRILWTSNEGQDIAEYAVMLAVILVLVIGTIRLVGGNANNAFSSVDNSLQ